MLALRAVLVLLLMLLTGCVPLFGIVAAPVGAIGTTVVSGKTPLDHVLSLVSGKDCSLRRRRQGLTYCLEDEPPPPAGIVCYRTLGDVACYDRPDPFSSRQRAVVEDPGVAVLVPFVTGQPIPPPLLPGRRQDTAAADGREDGVMPAASPPAPAGSSD